MADFALLDCTLRDGGYINNWHFGKDIISALFDKLSEARMDIIEVGFLTNLPHSQEDSLYACSQEIDAVVRKNASSITKIAAMIAIGEMELDPVILPPKQDTYLDIIRITFHNTSDEKEKAFRYARGLMEKGYLVCMQPVGTTSYSDDELIELINDINVLSPYTFYLVDTLGVLHRQELTRFIRLIDQYLAPEILLGFHSHNNLQMSYANAQCIAEEETRRKFIIDCSVYGMGRGAGNLCTELIAQYQNSMGQGHYELTSIYEALDTYIYPIFIHSGWGYKAHYYISAVHGCHPNYASFLMNKQTLTMNEVDLLLKNIPRENKYVFSKSLIEEMYYNFQNHNIDDTDALKVLRKALEGREILLLAPGRSLRLYRDRIEKFIQQKTPVVISINSVEHNIKSDYLFVSNLKRFYMLNAESIGATLILTSNLPNIIRQAIYVDYARLCDRANGEPDNSGIMLLRLLQRIGINCVYLAGYDGFSRDIRKNYVDAKLINNVDIDDIERKNEMIRRQFEKLYGQLAITFLTPSGYLGKLNGRAYKLIIFDLDGTLADTSCGILECHRFTNQKMGKPIVDETILDGVIGAPLLNTYQKRFGYSENEARRAIRIYREHYAEVGIEGTRLYTGMAECLAKLKEEGHLLAVATLKAEKLARAVLQKLGIDIYFDCIVGMDEEDSTQKADMLAHCMAELQVNHEHTLLIGDSVQDSQSAKEAGISFLGVTYGFGFTKEHRSSEVGALALVDDCRQLEKWFMVGEEA